MAAEPEFISSHSPATGTALVQTAPNIQAVNGETSVSACQLMSILPADGKAYLCDLNTVDCVPAGFAATDNPLSTTIDDTTKVTLIRQGRIAGFTGLVPGAIYYPCADTPGGVVPERGLGGPVITVITATNGASFLRNVHVRAGHRPAAGDWTITFPSATTCTITPPGGSASASSVVAATTAYNGVITGASDFYIETGSLTSADAATITVSYSDTAAVVPTLASPGNAFAACAPLPGAAGRLIRPGLYTVVTTATTATVAFNGSDPSAEMVIAADGVYFDLIPGVALTAETSVVTAETNYFIVGAQEFAAPVGIAVNASTLQVLMGGNG